MPAALPFAGYVRVSRVGDRTGPGFISPDVQADAITRLAAFHGLTVDEIVQELDVSGGKATEDRELGRLVRRVEAGELGGLLVWKVSRMSRSLVDGVLTAERIRTAGGRIVGEDLDTAAPMGRAILGFLLGYAEEELDQRRAGWREAQERAAGRGAYPSRPPLGYTKDDEGRLVPSEAAPAVTDAFRMRAQGDSLPAIQRMLRDRGVAVGLTTVTDTLRNPAYLGRIVHGRGETAIYVEGAHPALTDERTWQAAQRKGPAPTRNGRIAGRGVLLGLITCAGCGRPCTITGSGSGEHRRLSYVCRRRKGAECPAPAGGYVDQIDALVAEGIAARTPEEFGFWEAGWGEANELGAVHQLADEELEDFLRDASITALGGDLYNREVARRREAVQTAWDAFQEAADRATAIQSRGETSGIERERALARRALESVVLSKSTGHARWGPPVSERVAIRWRDA